MQHEVEMVSSCCGESYYDNDDENGAGYAVICSKCKKVCAVKEVCAYCHGTGKVSVDEPVYPGEPHMAATGEETCICKLKDPDYYDERE